MNGEEGSGEMNHYSGKFQVLQEDTSEEDSSDEELEDKNVDTGKKFGSEKTMHMHIQAI